METPAAENEPYLSRQLITYLGNKRSLLGFIGNGLGIVKKRLNKKKLRLFDVFSGSGIVSRFFKQHAELLIANDLEKYAEIISRCYLSDPSEEELRKLRQYHEVVSFRLKNEPLRTGIISELYAPGDDRSIRPGERVFYTRRNACYIDSARQYIEEIAEPFRPFLTAPLLSEASIHANTAGVFKGFYKDRATGIGRFGGSGGDALSRIKGDISLPFPVFSSFPCEVRVCREDANTLVPSLDEVDVAYFDPPYNQHPYGSNYFMLNLICDYTMPDAVSQVSGIPSGWQRSAFNRKKEAAAALRNLAETVNAKYLLISFNSEGFISRRDLTVILEKLGRVEILETRYNAFRGSRNLSSRDIHVTEYLYLVEKW
ncbi:DNA adenine methylase [Breznakiella homolactica]|uniref:site-specific DNA-methyltransferase (adenine-specific) n=1 Tax=Breznakiella homolactica TaxID=2798577 RepID=A0A7T7XRW6_9SPIR|nr:DNA adenine methylase [Breznakiella homolactica]QQO11356.1 DNA adenine methylase [Breznakiella homolactica]